MTNSDHRDNLEYRQCRQKLGAFTVQLSKGDPRQPFLRELVIPVGATGYVALFEIDDNETVTILAVRTVLAGQRVGI